MASVVVCGGGLVGLCAALLLARDGHEVTVLESDPSPPPTDPAAAWENWQRTGVAQFHQPHVLLARFREVLRTELPDVLDGLLAGGCTDVDLLAALPRGVTDLTAREGDDRLHVLAGRRPVAERVVATAAEREPRLTVRRGVRLAGLLTGPEVIPGVPHVSGVRTEDGETVAADVVVDAMGRRSPGTGWLSAVGATVPEPESSRRGFTYYSRFFTGPDRPLLRGGPSFLPVGSIALLALGGGAQTWSITIFTLTADAPVKALRFPEVFDRVVAAVPARADLLDGEPLTGVLPMAGVLNTRRRFVVGGVPVVTGYAPLADAWACTNPAGGRGLSVGLVHAVLLRDTVRELADDPAGFASAWHARTEEVVGPWYELQCRADDGLVAALSAATTGAEPPAPPPAMAALTAAALRDADAFRAMLETVNCLALPSEVVERPGVRERLAEYRPGPPPPAHGPDRARLMELVSV